MKWLSMLFCFLIFSALLCLPVQAAESDLWGLEALEEALPESAREYMGGMRVEEVSEDGFLDRIAQSGLEVLLAALKRCSSTAGIMLAVVLICSTAEAADVSGRSAEYVMLAGVAAIGSAAITDVNSYMQLGVEALQTLSDYSRVLLPVLAGTAAVSGAVGAAAAKCAATALFMDVLLSAATALAVPAICGFAALSVANAAVGSSALKTAARLMKTVCTLLLTVLSTAFTVWISVVGVVSGSADAVTTRLAKTAVSALPVVGRVVSDAAGTLAAVAASLRGMAGSFGLAAVLCICVAPFVELGARYLIYKLTAAICSTLAGGRLGELLDAMGSCFGMMLALTGTGATFMYISIFSLLRTVL